MKNVFYVLVVLISLCALTSCSPESVNDENNSDSYTLIDKEDAEVPGTRARTSL